ncbi:MAG: isoleucine--tRNA ligase [Candidatus Pelagibacterales bacterium]
MTSKEDKLDFSESLFLPKTDFAMRAGLPEQEPEILKQWSEKELYKSLRASSKGKEKFILHDGPPYANGHLHIGHALNKILKDFVVRSQQMLGKDSSYIPGWDCHGLPIEWKIEEEYRKKGLNKDEVDVIKFRKECREFADKWINIQREEFIRLGITGEWSKPYTTMAHESEAIIVKEFFKFLVNKGLYRGSKPVMWSTVEKTALAEAELEYREHKSITIFTKFPIKKSNDKELVGASVVIWTTTPWTIPGNRAIAYNKDISYSLYKVIKILEGSHSSEGDLVIIANELAEQFKDKCKIDTIEKLKPLSNVSSIICNHPFNGSGYEFDVNLYHADFVTLEQGTGFVHIAPGHGPDDYELGKANGVEVPETVDKDGMYFDHVPLFKGKKIFNDDGTDADANVAVLIELKNHNALSGKGSVRHSYPHSWRSKAPVIFRNTPQWFISMETNDLRKKALDAIEEVNWFPSQGKNRILSMIQNRPDWVVSRQRAWGVPLSIFYHKETGLPLIDTDLNSRIIKLYEENGCDIWFEKSKSELLGDKYNPNDYEKVDDILDVWFDSGCTHAFVLEGKEDQIWPASIYLEGTDQHRGWFHSSLLESCGTRGVAPYESVLTHGFVLHEDGTKMSKSSSNIVAPAEIVEKSGADILRLWVASSDYSEDLKIGPEIIKSNVDSYRRLRNCLRFILGNLAEFEESEKIIFDELPELDQYILGCLTELEEEVIKNYQVFEYQKVFSTIFNFCTNDLSAFYFDIRKDNLYCDHKSSHTRRATRTVLDILFNHLLTLLAPILCFTTEEAWQSRLGKNTSIHSQNFPEIEDKWKLPEMKTKWEYLKLVRKAVNGAIEIERKNKLLGSSLEASVEIIFSDNKNVSEINIQDLENICIVSHLSISSAADLSNSFQLSELPNVGIKVEKISGEKCNRCWKYFDTLNDGICHRCDAAIK